MVLTRKTKLMPRILRRTLYILIPFLLILSNSIKIKLTQSDRVSIRSFIEEWKLDTSGIHKSFESEVMFLQRLVNNVVATIEHKEISHSCFGNLDYYYRNREGFCYDRAVLMEKICMYYGFPFRHVFIYFPDRSASFAPVSLIKKGTVSHALLEVKTKKGWMAVGTNANWIGLDYQNNPLTIKTIRDCIKENRLCFKWQPTNGMLFWKEQGNNFYLVYGLYSRHGDFFKATYINQASFLETMHLLPDYSIGMLLYNLI